MKVGDLVRWHGDGRLGIVMSEVFDMRPNWKDEHRAIHVLTRHSHSNKEGTWTWLLEDIEVISENR